MGAGPAAFGAYRAADEFTTRLAALREPPAQGVAGRAAGGTIQDVVPERQARFRRLRRNLVREEFPGKRQHDSPMPLVGTERVSMCRLQPHPA